MLYYEYKGYMIYPTPQKSMKNSSWEIKLTIRHKNKVRMFSGNSVATTRGEAVFQCIQLGKSLIDDGIDFDTT